jgi:hypothetical protein
MGNTKVPIKTVLSDLWADLSASQKFIAIALVVLMIGALAASWLNTFQTWNTVRQYENQAIKADREKVEALEKVAKIAGELKKREEDVAKDEAKRDEQKVEVKKGAVVIDRDRAEYERAVRERRTDSPSTDQLCRELAALGYPCQPT